MKVKIFCLVAVLLLVLALLAGLHCREQHRQYQAQFVTIWGVQYEKNTDRLDLSQGSTGNLGELRQLPGLKQIDLRGTGLTTEDHDTLCYWFPECEILWDIPFQGSFYPSDTRELTVTSLSDMDIAMLNYFPYLRRIQARDCADYSQLQKLRAQRPDLEVNYHIRYKDISFSREITQLTIPGDDPEALCQVLPYFESLQSVTLTAPLAPLDQILALREAFPRISFTWQFHIQGVPANEFTEKLDLTGKTMTLEEVEALLPYLPNLTWLDLSYSGIDYDDLEQLDQRLENIRVVWTVKLGRWYRFRTDATWFMPVKDDFYPRGNDLVNLKYCHDIIALDIGHMDIDSCEFVAYMPKLKYLLMSDTGISDLTPLTGLKELIYLEIFLTHVWDCSPLLTITTLQDLNLCYTPGDVVSISKMPWLKNVWWTQCPNPYLLTQNLPNTNLVFNSPSSTGEGWRELPNYYAQRDIFGMRYMTG